MNGAGGSPPVHISFDPGETPITISGSVSYAGAAQGTIRLEFLQLGEGRPPELVHTQTLDAMGAFSLQAPKGFGEVYAVSFIDIDGDGPSPTDPAGMAPITIVDADLAGIVLALSDTPDLGPLTPESPPEGATLVAPPPGETSPEEDRAQAEENSPEEAAPQPDAQPGSDQPTEDGPAPGSAAPPPADAAPEDG